jgi:anti-anti-sigma factor
MPASTEELARGLTKVSLTGRIDIAAAQTDTFVLSMVRDMARSVIFDLTGVAYIASMGMRNIIVCAKAIQDRGGKVAMYGPPPDVREVITITGVDSLIPLFDTEAEAVASVRER